MVDTMMPSARRRRPPSARCAERERRGPPPTEGDPHFGTVAVSPFVDGAQGEVAVGAVGPDEDDAAAGCMAHAVGQDVPEAQASPRGTFRHIPRFMGKPVRRGERMPSTAFADEGLRPPGSSKAVLALPPPAASRKESP